MTLQIRANQICSLNFDHNVFQLVNELLFMSSCTLTRLFEVKCCFGVQISKSSVPKPLTWFALAPRLNCSNEAKLTNTKTCQASSDELHCNKPLQILWEVKVISETSTKMTVTSFSLSLLATPKTCDIIIIVCTTTFQSVSLSMEAVCQDQTYWKQRRTLRLCLMSTPSHLTSVGSRFVLVLQEEHKDKANSLPLTQCFPNCVYCCIHINRNASLAFYNKYF